METGMPRSRKTRPLSTPSMTWKLTVFMRDSGRLAEQRLYCRRCDRDCQFGGHESHARQVPEPRELPFGVVPAFLLNPGDGVRQCQNAVEHLAQFGVAQCF